MAVHLVPFGEPHELGVGCPCRPVAGLRLSRGRQMAVVEHRAARERWQGAQATARTLSDMPAAEPEVDGA